MIKSKDYAQPPCANYEQLLVLYYYGECTSSDRQQLEPHLRACPACQDFLADLRSFLPLTVALDEPPESFWQAYSRELKEKFFATKVNRWHWWIDYLKTRYAPAAAIATLVIALSVTLVRENWQTQDLPPAQEALLEVLPLAENLDFLTAMEILDSMDVIEEPGSGMEPT